MFEAVLAEHGVAADSVLGKLLWEIINDSQTTAWQNVVTDTGTTWQVVNTAEDPGWQIIKTSP